MRYHALATDYDGTLAHDGRVAPETVAALERLATSGRRLVLVTGREMDDLALAFDRLDLFDRVVAENGALLVDPARREERLLSEPPPVAFVDELRRRGVSPLGVGRGIVSTWEPNERIVLEVIRELGLELEIIFNKGAVMVLPSGVNKASGLVVALAGLGLSPHNAVAIGDAQNDHAFLARCEASVAVANALDTVKERADLVTRGDHGAGVIELVERILADDLAALEPALVRHWLPIGRTPSGDPVALAPFGRNVLVGGPSGSGKSTLTTTILESLVEHDYQFCLIDPEGDHGTFAGAVTLGDARRPPTVDEVLEVLVDPAKSVIVDLIGQPLGDRPVFLETLLPRLQEMRTRFGRPHWINVDEAHHLLPARWHPSAEPFPRRLGAALLVVVDPGRMARIALDGVDDVIACGDEPWATFESFARASGRAPAPARDRPPDGAQAMVWRLDAPSGGGQAAADRAGGAGGGATTALVVRPPSAERERHRRKYAEGELPPDRSFWFRGPHDRLNLRAQNLQLFVQIGDGVDDETWLHHLRAGDYSRWLRDAIKDDELAAEVAAVEQADGLASDPEASRARVRAAIEERYTAG